MIVRIEEAQALRTVAAALATKDVRDYLQWICLDIGNSCIVATDGHILARADVEIEDQFKLENLLVGHAGKEAKSFLFRLANKLPQGWNGSTVELNFTDLLARKVGDWRANPIPIQLAPKDTCLLPYVHWDRVDAHLKTMALDHQMFDGAFGIDGGILGRCCPYKVKIELSDQHSCLRVTPLKFGGCYVTIMPARF